MNCLKEAEHKLRDYSARKNAVISTAEQIEMLEKKSTGVRSAVTDATPVRGGGNHREDAMLHNIAMRAELQIAHDRTVEWVRNVERALAVLNDEERLVLDRFFIHRQKGCAERLMEELHLEQTQVYARRAAALRHFTIAMYGVTET